MHQYKLKTSQICFQDRVKTFSGGLLKKCGVMEALNRHERFILESPSSPLMHIHLFIEKGLH